jgi:hypothetical protein
LGRGEVNSFRLDALKASLIASVVTAFTVLSFPQYFLVAPFASGVNILSWLGFVTTIGIVSLIVLPPLFLLRRDSWSKAKTIFFVFFVSLFTLSTALIKIYTLVTMGTVFADYLILYPILFFIEWILPILYVILAFKIRALSPRTQQTRKRGRSKVGRD